MGSGGARRGRYRRIQLMQVLLLAWALDLVQNGGVFGGLVIDEVSSSGTELSMRTTFRLDVLQAITACHLRPGGAVFFSHRLMHWGSRGRCGVTRSSHL